MKILGNPEGRMLIFNTVKAILTSKDFDRRALRARLVFFNKNRNGQTPNKNEVRPIAISTGCQKIIERFLQERLERQIIK